ncbi:MAG: hypothetical protein D6813_03390 [Calditrichaeota bacterium]|nr:MAG: hypothetical protein D6813_03390 [Calditrichota bacterium]
MRSKILFCLFSLPLIFILACGGSQTLKTTAEDNCIPAWYTTIPQDPNYLFAVSTANSRDLGLATDKAVTSARAEIGRQMEVRIQSLQKRFDEEVGLAEDSELRQMFTQATKTVVSATLSGSRVREQKHCRQGQTWQAFVLVEYPIGAANQALLEQIKQNQNMYTRFRASETFKELEDEVKKFEEWKSRQARQNQ